MRMTTTRAAVAVLLLAGASLRTVQYASTPSMASDEAALALNVMDRGWGGLLTHPLLYHQVAPPGFLALERLALAIGGDREAAFRFFPYLFSLAALLFFWRVSIRYLERATTLAALAVFALSPSLILYAGTVKQYTADVAVTLLLMWMALRLLERPVSGRESAAMGVGGGVALLLSQPAVLVAFGLGLLLLIDVRRRRESPGPILAICAGWSVGAAVTTYSSLATITPATSRYMDEFWSRDFMPAPWGGLAELLWIPARLGETFSFFVAFILSPRSLPVLAVLGAYALLLVVGIPHLARREPRATLVLAVPVLVAIAASAARLLPLSGRVSLFVGPSLVIACFAAFDRIRRWLPGRVAWLSVATALALAILPAVALLARDPPPRTRSGTRPVLQSLRSHWRPGDELIAGSGQWAWISAEYYGRRMGLEGWTRIGTRAGMDNVEEYLREHLRGIDALRGSPRAWLYLEATVPCVKEMLHGYLGQIGTKRYSARYRLNEVDQVSAHLYDLSDPGRLASANAETYPLPACAGVDSAH